MSKNNYFTIEQKSGGYCIVLGNYNGKKVQSKKIFETKAAAISGAAILVEKLFKFCSLKKVC